VSDVSAEDINLFPIWPLMSRWFIEGEAKTLSMMQMKTDMHIESAAPSVEEDGSKGAPSMETVNNAGWITREGHDVVRWERRYIPREPLACQLMGM
jgi:hypothetical protein